MSEPAQPKGFLTIPEALRLKNEIGKSITWRGLNAIEVQALVSISGEQWRKVWAAYDLWYLRKGMGGFGLRVPIAVIVAGALLHWLGPADWRRYATTALSLGVLWLSWRAARREAHREAYGEGYEAGVEQGVHRTLGISDEDALEIHELARDLERDEHILGGLKGAGDTK